MFVATLGLTIGSVLRDGPDYWKCAQGQLKRQLNRGTESSDDHPACRASLVAVDEGPQNLAKPTLDKSLSDDLVDESGSSLHHKVPRTFEIHLVTHRIASNQWDVAMRHQSKVLKEYRCTWDSFFGLW